MELFDPITDSQYRKDARNFRDKWPGSGTLASRKNPKWKLCEQLHFSHLLRRIVQQPSQPPSSESSQLISQVQNVLKPRIKANSVKIDEFGKQHIKKAFAEIQDAWKTLED